MLSAFCSSALYGKTDSVQISSEAQKALEEINRITNAGKNKKKEKPKIKKTESQLNIEKEKKNVEADNKDMVDEYISSLKHLKSHIHTSYKITDVEISKIGHTKFYIQSGELQKALKNLRKNKELRWEINNFLYVAKKAKDIKSNNRLKQQYHELKNKYSQWANKSNIYNDAYEYNKGQSQLISIKEGYIADRIRAKRVGNSLVIKIEN